ncbi:MAG: hypothetical protein WAK03_10590 [Methylocystis sp.]|jgi:hypothetical protein
MMMSQKELTSEKAAPRFADRERRQKNQHPTVKDDRIAQVKRKRQYTGNSTMLCVGGATYG